MKINGLLSTLLQDLLTIYIAVPFNLFSMTRVKTFIPLKFWMALLAMYLRYEYSSLMLTISVAFVPT